MIGMAIILLSDHFRLCACLTVLQCRAVLLLFRRNFVLLPCGFFVIVAMTFPCVFIKNKINSNDIFKLQIISCVSLNRNNEAAER